jgi:class 3 adenylate cyclase
MASTRRLAAVLAADVAGYSRLMIDRIADTPEDKRILSRIGVNLGDVIVEPEDIYGEPRD